METSPGEAFLLDYSSLGFAQSAAYPVTKKSSKSRKKGGGRGTNVSKAVVAKPQSNVVDWSDKAHALIHDVVFEMDQLHATLDQPDQPKQARLSLLYLFTVAADLMHQFDEPQLLSREELVILETLRNQVVHFSGDVNALDALVKQVSKQLDLLKCRANDLFLNKNYLEKFSQHASVKLYTDREKVIAKANVTLGRLTLSIATLSSCSLLWAPASKLSAEGLRNELSAWAKNNCWNALSFQKCFVEEYDQASVFVLMKDLRTFSDRFTQMKQDIIDQYKSMWKNPAVQQAILPEWFIWGLRLAKALDKDLCLLFPVRVLLSSEAIQLAADSKKFELTSSEEMFWELFLGDDNDGTLVTVNLPKLKTVQGHLGKLSTLGITIQIDAKKSSNPAALALLLLDPDDLLQIEIAPVTDGEFISSEWLIAFLIRLQYEETEAKSSTILQVFSSWVQQGSKAQKAKTISDFLDLLLAEKGLVETNNIIGCLRRAGLRFFWRCLIQDIFSDLNKDRVRQLFDHVADSIAAIGGRSEGHMLLLLELFEQHKNKPYPHRWQMVQYFFEGAFCRTISDFGVNNARIYIWLKQVNALLANGATPFLFAENGRDISTIARYMKAWSELSNAMSQSNFNDYYAEVAAKTWCVTPSMGMGSLVIPEAVSGVARNGEGRYLYPAVLYLIASGVLADEHHSDPQGYDLSVKQTLVMSCYQVRAAANLGLFDQLLSSKISCHILDKWLEYELGLRPEDGLMVVSSAADASESFIREFERIEVDGRKGVRVIRTPQHNFNNSIDLARLDFFWKRFCMDKMHDIMSLIRLDGEIFQYFFHEPYTITKIVQFIGLAKDMYQLHSRELHKLNDALRRSPFSMTCKQVLLKLKVTQMAMEWNGLCTHQPTLGPDDGFLDIDGYIRCFSLDELFGHTLTSTLKYLVTLDMLHAVFQEISSSSIYIDSQSSSRITQARINAVDKLVGYFKWQSHACSHLVEWVKDMLGSRGLDKLPLDEDITQYLELLLNSGDSFSEENFELTAKSMLVLVLLNLDSMCCVADVEKHLKLFHRVMAEDHVHKRRDGVVVVPDLVAKYTESEYPRDSREQRPEVIRHVLGGRYAAVGGSFDSSTRGVLDRYLSWLKLMRKTSRHLFKKTANDDFDLMRGYAASQH